MNEPRTITAGDTATWTRTEALYPASLGWVLTYYLSLGTAEPITFSSTAEGDAHKILVSAAATAAWPAGTYHWSVRAKKDTEAHTLESNTLIVKPDPTASVDRRTHAEKCLATIETALEASVGSATVECELDGVRVKKDRSELLRIRDRYRSEVRRERGFPVFTTVPVRLR